MELMNVVEYNIHNIIMVYTHMKPCPNYRGFLISVVNTFYVSTVNFRGEWRGSTNIFLLSTIVFLLMYHVPGSFGEIEDSIFS